MDDFFKDTKPAKGAEPPRDAPKKADSEDQLELPPEDFFIDSKKSNTPKQAKQSDPKLSGEPSPTLVQSQAKPEYSVKPAGDDFFHDLKPGRADFTAQAEQAPAPKRAPQVEPRNKVEDVQRAVEDVQRAVEDDQRSAEKPQPSAQERTPGPKAASDEDADDDDDDWVPDRPPVLLTAYLQQKNWAGFFQHFRTLSTGVLFSSGKFFKEMPVSGGLKEPIVYLVAVSLIYALLSAILSLNFPKLFISFIESLIAVGVGAAAAQFLIQKLGGKGTFEGTLRVFAYSKATLLFAWIWLGAFPVGGIIAGLYSIYLNVIGMQKVHKMEDRKNLAVMLTVLAAIGFAIKMRLPH